MKEDKIREIVENNIQEIFNLYPDVMTQKYHCEKCGHFSYYSPELRTINIVNKITDYVMKWVKIREEIFISSMETVVDKLEKVDRHREKI